MLLPLIGAGILGAGAFAGYRFLRRHRFGAEPVVNHRIASSPHFWDGAFHNSVETPVLSDGSSMPAAFLPAHVGKFSLAPHPWYEPFELLTQYDWSERAFLTPVIGAPLSLTRADKTPFWWKTFI